MGRGRRSLPSRGAWIETPCAADPQSNASSLPSWERGLKQVESRFDWEEVRSLPSWERGLKLEVIEEISSSQKSLPSRERGLKHFKTIQPGENIIARLGTTIQPRLATKIV